MADKSERAEREEKILQFWKEKKIFEKSLEKDSPKGEFVFYDGPPFATGLPHYGSLLSSIVKDVIPRYKTMRGFHVRRRWGWDCHGLPIENMVEKELGIKNKKEIEVMGVAKFNRACRDSVLRFADEWKIFVDRIGRFVDYDNSYKTMDNSYIESVWWALKEIFDKGLLYEGRKVLLYCPHCETPLAKAEIAMDHSYKDITEESVIVEFRLKGEKNTSLLAWTTTPWTLPGNVALAVGKDIDYTEIEKKDMGEGGLVRFILAKDRLEKVFPNGEYKIIREMKGEKLVGLEYEPLFEIPAVERSSKKAHYIALGNFVNTEEGTGIVHTAVLYGEDDYDLGLKLDLPMVPLLDSSGHFNNDAPELIRGQYFKKAEKVIKEDLEKRSLLFSREMYTHSYPHCHRCGTALLYNALSSWFINIQKKKDRIIALNEDINWIPEHLKHGRFLNNLENAPDWTISRNRYWASPLPIWKDVEGKVYVIGSLDELKKHTKKSGNKYFVMRHGEAISNKKNVLDLTGDPNNHLTEEGRRQVERIKPKNIDFVFCSPFLRSRETAEIISKDFVPDERLREMSPDESVSQMRLRMFKFVFEIEKKYKDKNILILSHQGPLNVLTGKLLDTAEISEFEFAPFPHNENFELDLHRPYIDEIELISEDGKPMKRIPEVIDGWVESGSMPFAEYHYPMENKEEFKAHFPGDFIAEYIAQTRTWFYYMHVMSVLLFDSPSFRNVVTTGNILATDGTKMSKSKGNYTDPMINLDLYGADALRYYLMSGVVMQAEDTRFVDDEVRQVNNQVVNILWNSFKFYELYSGFEYEDVKVSTHVLDRWIHSRLNGLTRAVTEAMDAYDMVRATRPIREFISDFSTWYIRRSRDRFKSENPSEKIDALQTTRFVLATLAKIIAPVMPFIAEDIFEKTRKAGEEESVHLALWPDFREVDEELNRKMEITRQVASLGLEARAKANIKVRQPLNELRIKSNELGEEYLDLIRDELNVKRVTIDDSMEEEIKLDLNITPELLEEGELREVMRTIQEWRKEQGLKPGETAVYVIPVESKEIFAKYAEKIKKATSIEF